MFQIYLPIAEMSVHVLTLIALGGFTGVLSGMFGVGGGFLMTPFLIFLGVPPTVSVATSANQIVAASVSGFMNHWRRNNVDFKMGNLLMAGGLVGSYLGIILFKLLESLGQIDLFISLSYVIFLGLIGILMSIESGRSLIRSKKPKNKVQVSDKLRWAERLPFQMHFPKSNMTVSIIFPLFIGFCVGNLVSLMGIGGGFFLIPAMIYIIGMPTSMVVGTTLYQTIFVTTNVTIMHAVTTQTVDVVLAMIILTGAVIGAQVGALFGSKLPAEKLRALMAMLVLAVAIKLAFGLVSEPQDVYSIAAESLQ